MNPNSYLQAGLVCAAGLVIVSGCDGGPSHENPSDDGRSGREAVVLDVSSPLAHPPEPPRVASPGDGPGAVFAIDAIHLGQPRGRGVDSTPSWAIYGYDLDGIETGKDAATRSCAPAEGASKQSGADGVCGIDNAFGRALVPVFTAANDTLESSVNRALAEGDGLLIAIDDLGDAPTYTGLTATVYQRAPIGAPPRPSTRAVLRRDAAIPSPFIATRVRTGHVETPLAILRDTYVAAGDEDGTWVGRGDAIEIRIPALGRADLDGVVRLRVHDPILSMTFDEDRDTATGVLAGKLYLDELKPEFERFLVHVAPFFCGGLALDAARAHLDRSADIRADGLADPTLPCDAVSFGIGFEASRAQLGAAVAPPAPPSDPCAP